jgi:hypothetical protein
LKKYIFLFFHDFYTQFGSKKILHFQHQNTRLFAFLIPNQLYRYFIFFLSAFRWGYDVQTKSCQQYNYGGCLGNNNRYEVRPCAQVYLDFELYLIYKYRGSLPNATFGSGKKPNFAFFGIIISLLQFFLY